MTSGELANRARRMHLAACSRQYFAYDDMAALTLSERNDYPRVCRPMGTIAVLSLPVVWYGEYLRGGAHTQDDVP